ncbi:hypothetical protein [Xenorhabdus sp. SGI246]|uniref:hypothetical protein n=1 Tax=Xenorhabdus sp. SGI246 TaxID=3158263 RepID=UPI00349F1EFE
MKKILNLHCQKESGFMGMLLAFHALTEERFHDHALTDRIILNLVGECTNA